MQSYAVLYERSGRFLIVDKYDKGYFFHEHGVGSVKPAGQVLNGAARKALPGGKVDPGETPLAAAQREFGEETGVAIAATLRADEHVFGAYAAGYFRLSPADFNTAALRVANVTLPAGRAARQEIIAGTINAYPQIHTRHPDAPLANELAYGYIWDVTDPVDWPQIVDLRNHRDTSWYREILLHLRDNVLPLP